MILNWRGLKDSGILSSRVKNESGAFPDSFSLQMCSPNPRLYLWGHSKYPPKIWRKNANYFLVRIGQQEEASLLNNIMQSTIDNASRLDAPAFPLGTLPTPIAAITPFSPTERRRLRQLCSANYTAPALACTPFPLRLVRTAKGMDSISCTGRDTM